MYVSPDPPTYGVVPPITGPGRSAPLVHDFQRWTTTPEIFRTGLRPRAWQRLWGLAYPNMRGADERASVISEQNQYTTPASSPERIETDDVQRCITATLDTTAFQAWELGRFPVMAFGAGIVERIVTAFPTIEALDDAGAVLLTFKNLDGLDPCARELVHPLEDVPALRWRWRLLTTSIPNSGPAPIRVPAGPVARSSVLGVDVTPPWDDLRYGSSFRWGDRQQIVIFGRQLVSLWLELSLSAAAAPSAGGWRVHAAGRIAGYQNPGGRLGAAERQAVFRTV